MLIPNAPTLKDMADSSSTIPEATYNLRVEKADYVDKPKGANAKGPYIKTQLAVTGPDAAEKYLGRKVFQIYSLTGDGNFRLKELLKVTGHEEDFQLTDSDQLIGLEFAAAVVIQAGKDGYPDRNEIKRHLPLL